MIAMSEEQVYECLADAGCGKELIKQFEACQHSGSQKDQMRLLADYRRLLLERIHTEQRRESIEKMDRNSGDSDAGNTPDRRICGM